MKKAIIAALTVALLVALVLSTLATDTPFNNLFKEGFAGYTSDEGEILASEYVSSKPIAVTEGETVWFGPCEPDQYFQLVGFGADSKAVTDKIRGKELEIADTFGNGTVIYQYTVPAGVETLVFSVSASLDAVYTVAKTEITTVNWMAFWNQQNVDTDEYVGQNSFYEVAAGDKLYFGAITETDALSSVIYDNNGSPAGTMAAEDLKLIESFGGELGIYCYTVPAGSEISYLRINYDAQYEQYYACVQMGADETVSDETIVDSFITMFGIVRPLDGTVTALSGKSALFLGDSITYGARDRANIYACGGWAGRIEYYVGMDVTNNGVSGACISTARQSSHSEAHYIYNNLIKTEGQTFDYVIMHGLFNDASEDVPVGTMQGKTNFDPAKADATTYAGGLELLFHQARVQNPDAILGFIVNFETERAVDQAPYVEMAIAICEDWGIPYLDLYNRAGFSVEFDDGLHPSSAGYDSMYTIVANWMATLGTESVKVESGSSAEVMSYNVFWDLYHDGIENRTDKVLALMKEQNSDIMMLQEVSAQWIPLLKEFAAENGYSYYGYTHEQGLAMDEVSGGSHQLTPIFWKTEQYTLENSGHFWASSTPDVAGSASWENGSVSNYPRCINWVILKDNQTGGKLLVMNVHGDPNDETVRNLTYRLVVQKLDELRAANGDLAAVVGGDWNMSASSTGYYTVVGNGLADVRKHAAATTDIGSYNAWNRVDENKYAMGDYLFMAEGMTAKTFTVVSDDWASDEKTMHISDHCPIVVEVSY